MLKYSILDCFIWLQILLRNQALGVMFGLTIPSSSEKPPKERERQRERESKKEVYETIIEIIFKSGEKERDIFL